MGKHTNKHIIKIMGLIQNETSMGTFGLVELELMEMEKDFLSDPKNTIHNIEYEEIKPCVRLRDCSLVRIEGKCLGRDKCHVYKSV